MRRRILKTTDGLEARLTWLVSATPEELCATWRNTFRKAFPDHLPRTLIAKVLAHQAQVDALGDISQTARKMLDALADGKWKGLKRPLVRIHMPGTLYEREHAGILHRVVKTEVGFQWDGREYPSLSAVAFAITGTKWNGNRFFGITQRGARHGP